MAKTQPRPNETSFCRRFLAKMARNPSGVPTFSKSAKNSTFLAIFPGIGPKKRQKRRVLHCFCYTNVKNSTFLSEFCAGAPENDERFAQQAMRKEQIAKNPEFLTLFCRNRAKKRKRFARNAKIAKNIEFLALLGKNGVFARDVPHTALSAKSCHFCPFFGTFLHFMRYLRYFQAICAKSGRFPRVFGGGVAKTP